MLVIISLLGTVLDIVHMFSVAHVDGAAGFSPEFMIVLIGKIGAELHLMVMVLFLFKIWQRKKKCEF